MSEKNFTREYIEDILLEWIRQYGYEYTTGNGQQQVGVPVNSKNRIDMYFKLVSHFVSKENYTKEDLNSILLTNMVINASVPLNHDKKKVAEWMKLARIDWKIAVNTQFPIKIEDVQNPDAEKERPKVEKVVPTPKPEEVKRVLDPNKFPDIAPASVIDENMDIFADEDEAT